MVKPIKVTEKCLNEYMEMDKGEILELIDKSFVKELQYFVITENDISEPVITDRDGLLEWIYLWFDTYYYDEDDFEIDNENGIDNVEELVDAIIDEILDWTCYVNNGDITGFETREEAEKWLQEITNLGSFA